MENHDKYWKGKKNKEEWRSVVGYEGWYSVSSFGRVRRDKRGPHTHIGYILKQHINNSGYSFVGLSKNNKLKTCLIAQLVSGAFFGKKPQGLTINHKDGNKQNNLILNLEYCTYSENGKHAYKLGLKRPLRGEESSLAKICKKDVSEIKSLYHFGKLSQQKIGKIYNISQTHIGRIVRGKRWKTTIAQN